MNHSQFARINFGRQGGVVKEGEKKGALFSEEEERFQFRLPHAVAVERIRRGAVWGIARDKRGGEEGSHHLKVAIFPSLKTRKKKRT